MWKIYPATVGIMRATKLICAATDISQGYHLLGFYAMKFGKEHTASIFRVEAKTLGRNKGRDIFIPISCLPITRFVTFLLCGLLFYSEDGGD
jgi:hypothetical protein